MAISLSLSLSHARLEGRVRPYWHQACPHSLTHFLSSMCVATASRPSFFAESCTELIALSKP